MLYLESIVPLLSLEHFEGGLLILNGGKCSINILLLSLGKLKTYTPPFVGYFQYTEDFSTWHIKCVHSIKGPSVVFSYSLFSPPGKFVEFNIKAHWHFYQALWRKVALIILWYSIYEPL